jgi:hypothetical protein
MAYELGLSFWADVVLVVALVAWEERHLQPQNPVFVHV